MFCRNCGNKLTEGNLFCTACGAAVMGGDAAQEAPKATEKDDFVLSSTTQEAPKKKKSLKWIVPVACLCVVVAAVVAIVLNWGAISDLFGGAESTEGPDEQTEPSGSTVIGTVQADREYLQKIEKDSMGGLVNTVTEAYGALMAQPVINDIGGDVEVSVRVGDTVINLLEAQYAQQTGETMEFDWLSRAVLDMDVNTNHAMTQIDMVLALADQRIISLDLIMDMSEMIMYVGSPELSEYYAPIQGLDFSSYQQSQQQAEQLRQILPEEDVLNELLNRYIGIIIENLDQVEKTTQTLELDGLKQECTVLTVTIDAQTMANVLTAVLETAKTDADIKAIVDNYGNYYNAQMAALYAQYDMVWEDIDMYQSFTESVESALSSLESQEDLADEEGKILLHTYVDSADQVIGRKLTVEDGYETQELYYYTVTEGGIFCFEAGAEEVVITGSGTVKGDILDAEYILTVSGTKYLKLEIEDYDKAAAEAGSLSGTFRLEPTAELISQMLGSSNAAALADLVLEVRVASSNYSVDLQLDVLTNDTLLVGLDLAFGTKQAEDIQLPAQVIDPSVDGQYAAWVNSFNINQVLDNLRAAGVPEELVIQAEQLLRGFKEGLQGSSAEDTVPDYEVGVI